MTLPAGSCRTHRWLVVIGLLAVAALEAEPGSPRSVRVLACFELTAGPAWWTNFKTLEIILPALLVLWARDPWLLCRRAAALRAGGFLLRRRTPGGGSRFSPARRTLDLPRGPLWS